MKTLYAVFFVALAALFCARATAQTTHNNDRKHRRWEHDLHDMAGAAQLQFTYRPTDLGQLNAILGNNGIPPLSSNNVWINLSMNHLHGRWIEEDGLGLTPWSDADNNGMKARFNQYQAFLKFGYNVTKNPDVRLFPFAGVNLSAAMLNIEDNNAIKSTNNFSQEILNSTASKTFYQPNLGFEVGGGLDYSIKMTEKQIDCITIRRSIPIGLRAGYYINAVRGDWKISGYTLAGGPNRNQSAFFVSVNIGLGYAVAK